MSDVNRTSARVAAITINVFCISYYNILPLVLGGAADSRGIDDSQLGFAASAFMGGLALINFGGFTWLRRYSWKSLVIGGNLVAAATLMLPLWSFSFTIWVSCNLLAGMATGVSYGISIACLGDTREPERNYAFAYAGQTVLSASLIFLMPRVNLGFDLFELGHMAAAALMFAGLSLIGILPSRGAKSGLPRGMRQPGVRATPNLPLLFALALLLLNVMAEGAVWAFLERIAIGMELTTGYAATVIAISFLAAGTGSIAAAVIGTRFGHTQPFLIAVALSITSVWVLWSGGGRATYFAGVMLFAAAWNLGSPYRMALATSADRSGRYSTLVPATQTLGATLGPAAGGMLVVGGSFFYVYAMSSMAWLLTVVLFVAASRGLPQDLAA